MVEKLPKSWMTSARRADQIRNLDFRLAGMLIQSLPLTFLTCRYSYAIHRGWKSTKQGQTMNTNQT